MAATETSIQPLLNFLAKNSHLLMPAAVICIIAVMIVPMPSVMLDLLVTLDITLSVVILMVSMYIQQPVSFSVFPSLLLVVTLFRLSLNIAASRLILMHGSDGVSAAGRVIQSFGQFVIGGNYVIGIVMFLVLLAIQYIVVNHGATRIAEVTARFTLDSLPGKQMSIDAELNSGLINEEEARTRRKQLQRETEFYGAMDGAIKFTQRDAIAAVIITSINIIAGIVIGVLQYNMSITDALQTFTVLTIGDGLVTAIPALLISVAGGLITTRAASESNLSDDVSRELLKNPRPVAIGAVVLLGLGLIPGLPKLAFLLLAAAVGAVAYIVNLKNKQELELAEVQAKDSSRQQTTQENLESLLKVDPLALEVGYALIPLIDNNQGGDVLARVKAIRRQIALDLGVIVPPIHITDNFRLNPREYSILLKGVEIARGDLSLDSLLAIKSGSVREEISGVPTTDPTFNLPAVWIKSPEKERAQMAGYTVVDPPTVLATHLSEVIKSKIHELLGRQETKGLLDHLGETHQKLVEETIPKVVSVGEVQKVLQNLLRERVSIRDLGTILENIADGTAMTKDPDLITEYVRQALARSICKGAVNDRNELMLFTLSPDIEQTVAKGITHTEKGFFLILEPKAMDEILRKVNSSLQHAIGKSQLVLLTSANIRIHLKRLTERILPNLVVLSHNEIPNNVKVLSLGTIG